VPRRGPALDGIHQLKLPVTEISRSLQGYQQRLGYEARHEFVEDGEVMGWR
jgi:hypothetical protein